MTIKHAVRLRSWQSEKSYIGTYRYMKVEVSYLDVDGMIDKVIFRIKTFCVEELDNFFRCFCRENGVKTNSVTDICILQVTERKEELI